MQIEYWKHRRGHIKYGINLFFFGTSLDACAIRKSSPSDCLSTFRCVGTKSPCSAIYFLYVPKQFSPGGDRPNSTINNNKKNKKKTLSSAPVSQQSNTYFIWSCWQHKTFPRKTLRQFVVNVVQVETGF